MNIFEWAIDYYKRLKKQESYRAGQLGPSDCDVRKEFNSVSCEYMKEEPRPINDVK